jgi:hypothetical protein
MNSTIRQGDVLSLLGKLGFDCDTVRVHAPNDLAKKAVTFHTTIPRARLRPRYGQGGLPG